MRVKWKSKIKTSDARSYQAEVKPIVKKDVIEKGVEPRKSRYIVVDGIKQTIQKEVEGKPSVIKETIIQEESPYVEQLPAIFENLEFDVDVNELQDYGKVKYYQSEYGKIRVSEDAVYYEG